ncbi:hypothetical protein Ddye_030272 [Dipteronia dyeriana]|uniref:Uncharacterized protein n=1 Tax=Dipteronia dyeriana TaxID=168575 RepID=A0AAD9TG12_9ROSI|nr:hypothetical protein Ddye_030272 [Dipteronia dyeriana]
MGSTYTWSNKREGYEMVYERLNRCVCNYQWRDIFTGATVSHLEFWKSDHCPIMLDSTPYRALFTRTSLGHRRRFHFEECWARSEGYVNIVRKSGVNEGESANMQDLVSSIQFCTSQLREWNEVNRKGFCKEILRKHKELQQATKEIHTGSWRSASLIERELYALLENEEIYWRQRLRATWLKRGDKNSRSFHSCALSRRSRNTIKGIYDSEGK